MLRRLSCGIPRFFATAAHKHPCVIIYGSQTGTAQAFAEDLSFALKSRSGIDVPVLAANTIGSGNLLSLDAGSYLIISSCYGEGEPPDNFKNVYDWIMMNQDSATVKVEDDRKFAVFGLGNSKCFPSRYQKVGRDVDKGMQRLGFDRLLECGEGDDGGDIETDFEEWQEKLVPLVEAIVKDSKGDQKKGSDAPNRFVVKRSSDQSLSSPGGTSTLSPSTVFVQFDVAQTDRDVAAIAKGLPFESKILGVESVGKDPSYPCKRIAFAMPAAMGDVEPGDHLGIFAHNAMEEVERFVTGLGLQRELHNNFSVYSAPTEGAQRGSEQVISVEEALTRVFDLRGTPSVGMLQSLLSQFPPHSAVPDSTVYDALQSYSCGNPNSPSMTSIKRTIRSMGLTWADVPTVFPWLQSAGVTWNDIVQLLPTVKPRYYSIAHVNDFESNSLSLMVRKVSFNGLNNQLHHGLCSGYLHQISCGESALISVRKSTFRRPVDWKRPIVMIAAGTGIAPFAGFLQSRQDYVDSHSTTTTTAAESVVGPAYLFFGCRNPQALLLGEELQERLRTGVLTNLFPVYSDKEYGGQFLDSELLNHSALLKDLLLHEDACIYICGGASGFGEMVRSTLANILAPSGMAVDDDFKMDVIGSLISQRRYFEDLAD